MSETLIYTYSGKEISMTLVDSKDTWIQFFDKLARMDFLAPFHAVLNFFALLYELDIALPASPHSSLYYDVAIELAADDRYPAFEAAVSSGFFSKGLSMIAHAAMADLGPNPTYITVLTTALDRGYISDHASEETKAMVSDLLGGQPNEHRSKVWWTRYLETQMRNDPSAPTSILAYYLDEINEHEYHIFCPLGFEEYEVIGAWMRDSNVAFEAALDTGLLADAVPIYVNAALDNAPNWRLAARGIKYLLDHAVLGRLIPFDSRFVAKQLLDEFGIFLPIEDEEEWGERCADLREMLRGGMWRGY